MYTHSVTLEAEKCIGCTDCIKRCPTEAIRVKQAKANIIEERCIDCGNCIAVCHHGAKQAVMDKLETIYTYQHRVALPAPAFYGQFSKIENIRSILDGLYQIGFTDVVEVATAAEVIAEATRTYILKATERPVISSACPVIVRLIERRFPSLIDNILPIMSPMELAARFAKEKYIKQGIKETDVGVFFISPCPAKATDIHKPKGLGRSYVDKALSMQEVYKKLTYQLKIKKTQHFNRQGSSMGLTWAMQDGSSTNVGIDNAIAVDGLDSVIDILEKIEDGTLNKIHYVEALACVGGCLGGALTVNNPFISRHTLKRFIDQERECYVPAPIAQGLYDIPLSYDRQIVPRPVFSLDDNLSTAINMMEQIERLYVTLPQINCGACGAPTCRCFAEDVVKGFSHIEDCIFMLRKRIKELSEAMFELTTKVLPAEENKEERRVK
jgi:iron only hydrogenase large subunit-like protein